MELLVCLFHASLFASLTSVGVLSATHDTPARVAALVPEDRCESKVRWPSNEELFDAAPTLQLTPSDLQGVPQHVRQSQDYCTTNARDRAKSYEQQTNQLMAELKRLGNQD